MNHRNRFEKKVAIVTGGGSGLGQRIAMDLASEGAAVAIPDINLEAAELTAKDITSKGGTALALKVDVSQGEDVGSMVDKVARQFGGLDILVNNAGIVMRTPLLDLPEKDWERELSVDLKAPIFALKIQCHR